MKLLNGNGIDEFRNWIESLKANSTQETPTFLLDNETYSYELDDKNYKIYPTCYEGKLDLVKEISKHYKYLEDYLKGDDFGNFFTTIALLYFKSICKGDSDAGWIPLKSTAYYIFGDTTGHQSKNYAHRIYSPLMLYLICPGKDGINPFFADHNGIQDKCHTINQFEQTVGSNMEIFNNKNLIKFLNKIYVDSDGNRKRRIYNKPSRGNTGTIQRVPRLHRQCKINYNLYEITPEAFFSIFPKNFTEPWLKSTEDA